MSEPIQKLRENLNAPKELVEAVRKGLPYERVKTRSADTKRRHVKRFTAAIAIYACIAVMLIGITTLLPSLLNDLLPPAQTHTDPPPSSSPDDTTNPPDNDTDPDTDMLSPEALYQALLDAEEASFTVTESVEGGIRSIEYSIDGSVFKRVYHYNGETTELMYYDLDEGLMYVLLDGEWLTDTPDPFDRADVVSVLNDEFFEDDCYEKGDDGYRFTDDAIAEYCQKHGFDGNFEVAMTYSKGIYTMSVSLTGNSTSSDFELEYIIGFPSLDLKLPDDDTDPDTDMHSPEAVGNALKESDDYTIYANFAVIGEDDHETKSLTKEGDHIMALSHFDHTEMIWYFDLEKSLVYYYNDIDGEWSPQAEEIDLDALLANCFEFIDMDILFSNASYEDYAPSRNCYQMKENALARLADGYFGVNIEGNTLTMSGTDGEYTFTMTSDGSDGKLELTFIIRFEQTSVTLPDLPVVNDQPPADRLLAPSEFFEALRSGADMTVRSQMRSGEWLLDSLYVRDGGLVKETGDAGNGEWVIYYDFSEGCIFTQGELGEWVLNPIYTGDPDSWRSIVDMYVIGNGWEMFGDFGRDYLVMFEDANFSLKDGRYAPTEAFLAEYLEHRKADCAAGPEYFVEQYGEHPTCEISFEYEGGSHRFSYRFLTEDGRLADEMVITLTFGDQTVDLPEVA